MDNKGWIWSGDESGGVGFFNGEIWSYLNTNDGYTVFEDGTQIESVKNRILIFKTSLKHTGTNCTDQKRRVLINFNYYK